MLSCEHGEGGNEAGLLSGPHSGRKPLYTDPLSWGPPVLSCGAKPSEPREVPHAGLRAKSSASWKALGTQTRPQRPSERVPPPAGDARRRHLQVLLPPTWGFCLVSSWKRLLLSGPPAVLSFPELSALLLWRFITSGALTHYPLRLCEAPVSQSGSPRLLGGPHVGRSRGLTPRPPASAGPGALVPECRHQSRPNEKDPQGRTP